MALFARRAALTCFTALLGVAFTLAQQPKPVPVPPAEDVRAAVETLKDVFDKDYAAKDGSDTKRAFVKKLFDLAPTRKTPAMVFACLDESRRLAAEGGDLKAATDAIDAIQLRFTNFPLHLVRDTLKALAANTSTANALVVVRMAREEVSTALDRDDYATAIDFTGIAATAAKRAENAELALELRESQALLEAVQKAVTTLKTKPDDAEANTALGNFWAFDRGKWGIAVRYLAKGTDKALAELSSKDLAAPKTAKDRTALGDQWRKFSLASEGVKRRQYAERAWEWYTAAVAVATGDDDLKPSERAKEIEKEFPLLFNKVMEGHTAAVACVAVTPDGTRVISVGNDNTLRVCDAATGQLRKTVEGHSGWVGCLVLSADGTRAYTAGGDNVIRIWDLDTFKPVGTLEGHTVAIRGLALTADGKFLVSGASDKTIRLWDLATLKSIRKFGTESSSVECVAVTPDGSRILAGTENGIVTVFDASNGNAVSKFEGHSGTIVYAVAVTKDGKTAVTGARDKSIRVWDTETGKELRVMKGHTEQVYQVSFDRAEKRVLSASFDKTARVWDFATGKELRRYEGHTDGVQGACYSPDGRAIFTASWDKTVRKWRVVGE